MNEKESGLTERVEVEIFNKPYVLRSAGGAGRILEAARIVDERMRQISAAVQEGAKAYLNRQVITISVIAVILFVLLWIFKDHTTAIGFVIGATCSLSAGFIGMRIAVIANVRTTGGPSITVGLRDESGPGTVVELFEEERAPYGRKASGR